MGYGTSNSRVRKMPFRTKDINLQRARNTSNLMDEHLDDSTIKQNIDTLFERILCSAEEGRQIMYSRYCMKNVSDISLLMDERLSQKNHVGGYVDQWPAYISRKSEFSGRGCDKIHHIPVISLLSSDSEDVDDDNADDVADTSSIYFGNSNSSNCKTFHKVLKTPYDVLDDPPLSLPDIIRFGLYNPVR